MDDRFNVGDIVFLRAVVTGHDDEHGCPLCIETISKSGERDAASLTYWVRPEHLVTRDEARRAAIRK